MSIPSGHPREDGTLINDRIRAPEVRLIDFDGTQLGIRPTDDALALAAAQELDLVQVASGATPPVCRIMDYRKHRFAEAQRARQSRRNAQQASQKDVRFGIRIGPRDLDIKLRAIRQFLEHGHRVKINVRLRRGREMGKHDLRVALIERIVSAVADAAKVEAAPRTDGAQMTLVLTPRQQPTRPSQPAS